MLGKRMRLLLLVCLGINHSRAQTPTSSVTAVASADLSSNINNLKSNITSLDNSYTSQNSSSNSEPEESVASIANGSSAASSDSSTSVNDDKGPRYMIFPVNGKNPGNRRLTAELIRRFGDSVYEAHNPLTGTVFWEVPLSARDVDFYKANPLVANITPSELEIMELNDLDEDHYAADQRRRRRSKRMRTRRNNHAQERNVSTPQNDVLVQPAPIELANISLPPGHVWDELKLPPVYAYLDQAGEGNTIYVLDSGFKYSSEFAAQASTLRYMASKPIYGPPPPEQSEDASHGTCVAAKAVGAKLGVAKKARLVSVKLAYWTYHSSYEAPLGGMVDALSRIISDMYQFGTFEKSVINISVAFFINIISTLQVEALQRFKELMRIMIEKGVIFVIAAGNDPHSFPIAFAPYPSSFRQDLDIIVVGATDNNRIADFSWGQHYADVFAPGTGIRCPDGLSQITEPTSGTSFSAPAVAGLAAYYMSLPRYRDYINHGGPAKRSANMRSLLQALAYRRVADGPSVVWNGVDIFDKNNATFPSFPIIGNETMTA